MTTTTPKEARRRIRFARKVFIQTAARHGSFVRVYKDDLLRQYPELEGAEVKLNGDLAFVSFTPED